jgi:putative tricarboxylic transport membrane protein
VEVIVGTSAGGAADHTARMVQKLLQGIKVNGITVNKPGASYAASFVYLNQHPGDAHYLAISPINLLTNRILGLAPLGHGDITPLAQLISDYHVFSVRADSPIMNGADLIAALKRDPAALSIAISPGFGSANHFAAGTVFKAAAVDIKRLKLVAFASGGESTTNVLGGHADVLVSATPAVTPMIEAGKMRAIAISSDKRIGGAFAKVPTWKEQGVNATFSNWRGVIGPKDMTPAQIAFWDATLERISRSPEWRSDLERNFQDPAYLNSRDSKRFLDEQSREIAALLTELGLTKGAAK